MELRKNVLGPEDQVTLARMSNIALVLSGRGKNKVAEELHRQTPELRENVPGHECPIHWQVCEILHWCSRANASIPR